MIIDNGRKRRLIVAGVFDGECGESDGLLSFIPNRATARPESVRGGLLDGDVVILSDIKTGDGPFVTARYRVVK